MPSRVEANKALVRRFFTAIETVDFAIFDEIVAVDYDDHLDGQPPGREALKQYYGTLHAALSELEMPIAAIVAEGDKVAVLNSLRGRHTGMFVGLEASGSAIETMAFQLYRVENGQLAERWEVTDFATLLQQMYD